MEPAQVLLIGHFAVTVGDGVTSGLGEAVCMSFLVPILPSWPGPQFPHL